MPPLQIHLGMDADDRALFAFQGDGGIDRNPVQPGKKLGITLESVQRLIRIEKGVLDHVLGVFRIIHQSENGIKKPILVAADQLSKGRCPACQAIRNEPVIISVHRVPAIYDEGGAVKVPWAKAFHPSWQK
jgi:hypothetical protein